MMNNDQTEVRIYLATIRDELLSQIGIISLLDLVLVPKSACQ